MLCVSHGSPGETHDVFLSGRLVDATPDAVRGQLFTLLDRADVAAMTTITSDYINLEVFSEVKVYFQRNNEV